MKPDPSRVAARPARSPIVAWLAAAAVLGLLLMVRATLMVDAPRAPAVEPFAETEPVPHPADAADDPAIWRHPRDPALSLVIGTDKGGGLAVYDLSGKEVQYIEGGRPNNVDLRDHFPLGDRRVSLVAVSDRARSTVGFYTVDAERRRLEPLECDDLVPGIHVYGCCMYRSAGGRYYVIVTSYSGGVEQWEVSAGGDGNLGARLARRIDVGTEVEGCVADDELGYLYLAEEDAAIWRYGAEPDAGAARRPVDRVRPHGRLSADIEGLALYAAPGGRGYLIASSQGRSEFLVYEREGDNAYAGTFEIGASAGIDGVVDTDGIEVSSFAFGERFPEGLFVAQDGSNDDGHQNFKLVRWEAIARAMTPPLRIAPSPPPHPEAEAAPPAR